MARHRKLTQKFAGFPMFKLGTSGDTYPFTSPLTSEFVGLDQLSLDLQFAADKSLTARRGPTPVFTRGSSATQVGAAGLIEYAPENEYQRSQEFNDASWSKTNSSVTANAATAPDGTLTADKLVENAAASVLHSIQNSASFASGGRQTFSIFAKKGERDFIVLRAFAVDYFFNLNTGVAITAGGTITDQGNGWYRCSVTTNTGTQSSIKMSPDGVTSTYTGDGTSGIFIWGAQLERSSTARAYIPTTTAAVYNARFDHDPVTLACKGLLIEEGRTNIILQSEDFGTTWIASQSTVSTNVATAPNGLVTADKIIPNLAAGSLSRVAQSFTLTGAHTMSVFAKASEWGWILVSYGPISNTGVWFNLTNGTIGTQTAGLVGSIIPYGNGWYKCIVAFTGAGTSLTARFRAVNADNESTLGDGTSGVFVWGAQLEVGSFATSYIPTTIASLARSADVCSITAGAFTTFWNNNEGTMFASGDPRGSTAGSTLLMVNSGANSNQIACDRTTTTIKFGVANSGSYTASIQQNSTNASFVKIAGSYATNDARSALNGTLGTPDTSVIVPTNLIRFNIGSAGLASQEFANGCIFAIRYFRKPLSNAKLQSLTV